MAFRGLTVLSRLKRFVSCQHRTASLQLKVQKNYVSGTTAANARAGLRYENMYDRLLQVYSTPEGTVSVKRFLEVSWLITISLRFESPLMWF